MFKVYLEKAEELEIKLLTSAGSWKKQDSFRKTFFSYFIDYAKDFDCVDHNKLWDILEETVIPDHLICLLRNLCAGQKATVRTGQIGTGSKLGTEKAMATHSSTLAWKIPWMLEPGRLQSMGLLRVEHD